MLWMVKNKVWDLDCSFGSFMEGKKLHESMFATQVGEMVPAKARSPRHGKDAGCLELGTKHKCRHGVRRVGRIQSRSIGISSMTVCIYRRHPQTKDQSTVCEPHSRSAGRNFLHCASTLRCWVRCVLVEKW